MRIESGTHTVAQLVTDDGEVIATGTYTHCGKILDNISSDFDVGLTAELRAEIQKLKDENDALQCIRDNCGACSSGSSLHEVWILLDVADQRSCIERIKQLIKSENTALGL